jgi:hypothetical protein
VSDFKAQASDVDLMRGVAKQIKRLEDEQGLSRGAVTKQALREQQELVKNGTSEAARLYARRVVHYLTNVVEQARY